MDVVYNGIDLDKFEGVTPNEQMLKIKEGNEKIIFFPARVVKISTGEMSKQKNFELVLKAASELARRGTENFKIVTVFNESTEDEQAKKTLEKLNSMFSEYGIEDKVRFIPPINPKEMPSYYAGADILCVPSTNETFGLVYPEAMAAGKVAIASNTGGPREYIENGKNGFLVDPEDESDLTNVLERLLIEDGLIEKIGKEGKETAKRFSMENMMNGIMSVYRELGVYEEVGEKEELGK
jgi:D-inositol-3-phosphate glycosyltransferase